MNIILLSGGSGKRLWPLSNEIRSKQFIKIFKTDDGYESMVQRIYRQILSVNPQADITIATTKAQVSAIHNQLGDSVGLSVEPARRDTFPAIALASAFMKDERHIDENESVVVCPIDPYVDESYFKALEQLTEIVTDGKTNLALLGMEPTYPSEKYGYIIPKSGAEIAEVLEFKEKPDEEAAKKFIKSGGLWNGGVFAYRLSYLLDIAERKLGFRSYRDLKEHYDNLPKISFDYAVVEEEPQIKVLRFDGLWNDLGTWNTLTEAMDEKCIGDARQDETCDNVHILNELDMPILAMGLHDVVISASPEGILVSDKEKSSYIKPYVDKIHQDIRFAEKSWGSFKVVDVEDESLTIKVTLNAGHSMNYHSHERRDEIWTVISGSGRAVVDGEEKVIRVGDVISMKAGERHTVFADTELKMIEVQLGKDIKVSDKQKYNTI